MKRAFYLLLAFVISAQAYAQVQHRIPRPQLTVYNVRHYGAIPDDDLEDTAAFERARDIALDSGGGVVYAPAGTYDVNFFLTENGEGATVKLLGDYGGTYLRSFDDGGFAVTIDNAVFATEPWHVPVIENIAFLGDYDGTTKRSGGICQARRANLKHVGFKDCAIGIVRTDNYYGKWEDLNFKSCDIGILGGTFASAAATISDLIDGDAAAHSITLSAAAANANGHSGNLLIDHLRINGCRAGALFLAGSNYTPFVEIHKATIEGCEVGLGSELGDIHLRSAWFESNSTGSTLTVDGITMNQAGVWAKGTDAISTLKGYGASVHIQGGRIGSTYADSGGRITLDDVFVPSDATISQAGTGAYDLRRVKADNRAIAQYIQEPIPALSAGRNISCFVRHKSQKEWASVPHGGDILISEPFTSMTFTSSKVSNFGAGTRTWETVGGLFSDQKCLQVTASTAGNNYGFTLDISGDIDSDKYYALTLAVKPDTAISISQVNLSQTWNTASPTLPTNKWTTIGMVARFGNVGGGSDPSIRWNSSTGAEVVQFGGLQVVEFDNPVDAARFCREAIFYMTE